VHEYLIPEVLRYGTHYQEITVSPAYPRLLSANSMNRAFAFPVEAGHPFTDTIKSNQVY